MKENYKYNRVRHEGSKIKNIIIFILLAVIVFLIVCLYNSVNVRYEPVIQAVSENRVLKERISELEENLSELEAKYAGRADNNDTIASADDESSDVYNQ